MGGAGGEIRQTGSVEGPILVDSDVNTDDDSGEFGGEPDGNFTVGPAGASLARPSGRPSRFAGRERPGWTSASTRGPVRGTAGQDRRAGMVGHVFRIYKARLSLRWKRVVHRPCDTPPRLMGSGLPPWSGHTRRAPTFQKALRRRGQGPGAAEGAKPAGECLLGYCKAPRDQDSEGGGAGGGGLSPGLTA